MNLVNDKVLEYLEKDVKYYLVYITEAREKYEFSTHIVGLYKNRKDAEKGLVLALNKNDFLRDPLNDDGTDKLLEEFVMTEIEKDDFDYNDFIDRYEDSYMEEGWEFNIKEIKPQ